MGRYKNVETGVVFSVDDSKDERYAGDLYEVAGEDKPAPKKAPAKSADK